MPLSARGTISIPAQFRKHLDLARPGIQIEVRLDEQGTGLHLQPCVTVPADQAWYWTPEWQAMEREADEDYARGNYETFDSDEEFLASFGDPGADAVGEVDVAHV